MADRVSAQITFGGSLPVSALPELIAAIQDEGLSIEYDGEPFEPSELVSGEALTLCAHEVAWGTFNVLEAFCRTHRLAYSRWYGACSGAWGSGRSIYRGADETREGDEGPFRLAGCCDLHVLVGCLGDLVDDPVGVLECRDLTRGAWFSGHWPSPANGSVPLQAGR